MTEPITMTRRYGETERITTAKELIMEAWRNFLIDKVDSNGNLTTYSSSQTRLQYVANKLMENEIKAASFDIREQLSELIDDQYRKRVVAGILSAIGLNLAPKE